MTPPIISVAILNYRRQSNVLTIVETLRQQTMPAKILVWDNSGSEEHIPGADLIVRAWQVCVVVVGERFEQPAALVEVPQDEVRHLRGRQEVFPRRALQPEEERASKPPPI